jgi:hypothetical protein
VAISKAIPVSWSIVKVSTVMSSENGLGLRSPRRKLSRSTSTEKDDGSDAAFTKDALTDQLHRLYDSITQEPIPDNLLELLRKMDS